MLREERPLADEEDAFAGIDGGSVSIDQSGPGSSIDLTDILAPAFAADGVVHEPTTAWERLWKPVTCLTRLHPSDGDRLSAGRGDAEDGTREIRREQNRVI